MRRTRSSEGGSRFNRWEPLKSELLRSRRYRRPFALLRIACAKSSQPDLTRELGELVRRSDSVWADGDAVYVLLPESNRHTAAALLTRIERDAPGVLDGGGAPLAVFPIDGVTSGALLAALDGRDPHGHAIPEAWLSAASRD